jgi:hypothetical protein
VLSERLLLTLTTPVSRVLKTQDIIVLMVTVMMVATLCHVLYKYEQLHLDK